MFHHRNWEGWMYWWKDRGDKAEKRQLLGIENCTVLGYQDTSTWTYKENWIRQVGDGDGKYKRLKEGLLIFTECLLCASHFINAVFDTSNLLMEVFALVYSPGNCGLEDSRRPTWDSRNGQAARLGSESTSAFQHRPNFSVFFYLEE